MKGRDIFFWIFTVIGLFSGSAMFFRIINAGSFTIGELPIFPFFAPFIDVFLFILSFFGILYLLYSK